MIRWTYTDSARRFFPTAIVKLSSPQRLTRELGWRPRFSDLETIVRTAWEWKQKHSRGYRVLEDEPSVVSRS